MSNVIHPIYLPFTEDQLKSHFLVDIGIERKSPGKHLAYFKNSVDRYITNKGLTSKSLSILKMPFQIEKDEKFWTTATMMTLFYSPNRQSELKSLLSKAFGDSTPIKDIGSWDDCLGGDLKLYFEPNIPSPKSFKEELCDDYLKKSPMHHFIPHVFKSAEGKKTLEGPTNVDALWINPENGFSIMIEAKVLSDISYQTTYSIMRNQIARNIDIMLEKNKGLGEILDKRDPDRTLFLLLTPEKFQQNHTSRLYGYKMNEYRKNPTSLGDDLPHRQPSDWEEIVRRIGWITWEDCKCSNIECCQWLV